MRRIVFLLPLVMLGVAPKQFSSAATVSAHDLISYDCASCERRIVTKAASFDECQRAAYAMNDGADGFMSVHPRNARKFECRPAH